jgi:hypothetical protein
MNDSPSLTENPASVQPDALPLGGLLALACAGFITILTEAMPAGLLPQMSEGLGVSPALAGQLVTVYALGSLLAAIPLTLLTRGWRRRPLLLLAIGGFALVNSMTALSSHYGLTLTARFCRRVRRAALGVAGRICKPHGGPSPARSRHCRGDGGRTVGAVTGHARGDFPRYHRWLAPELCDHDRVDAGAADMGAPATAGFCRRTGG